MSESEEALSPLDTTEASSFHDRLPTTLEIAQAGTQEFKRVLHATRHWERGAPAGILFNKSIRNCFLGISPHVSLSEKNLAPPAGEVRSGFMQQKFIPLTRKNATNILIVPLEKSEQGFIDQVVLVNIKAAQRVVSNYPEYFPDIAQTDTKAWATAFATQDVSDLSSDERERRELQIGLLSGYPLGSVLEYPIYRGAISKISTHAPELLFDTIQAIQSSNDRNRTFLNKVVEDLANVLDVKERRVLLAAHMFDDPLQGGVSLDEERDRKYIEKLKEIYEQSGLRDVVQEFWDYLMAKGTRDLHRRMFLSQVHGAVRSLFRKSSK